MSWYYQQTDQQFTLCFDCYQDLNSTEKELFKPIDILERMNFMTSGANNNMPDRIKRNNWSIEENMKLLDMMSSKGRDWS